jgi:hypothetical protein
MSDITVNQPQPTEAPTPTNPAATSGTGIFEWARKLGEDWWSVLLALVLLTLVISRILTAIP